ncbi:MAG: hypothetical protein HDS66_07140 [Bacteroidales bacterium]|nr:hypothetical protein [Bacteroidales bacterium]
MSKYINRANELLSNVQSKIDAFELKKGTSGWPDYYDAPNEIVTQYPELLLDVQTLFFADSPQLPLFEKVKKMSEQLGERYGGSYSEFISLRDILSKYIEYRTFLEAED